ncbi:hypothetical protein [Bacillus marasmi]|uniref:hypothetical protein n=1 Tax=Bacillus marasmi TaxID=1926279 RepID=UPI0011CBF1E5|nr:hypothetical protein [Bacillus marasmi]
MISSNIHQEEFIFSTTASDANSPVDEFILELFDYSPNQSCEGTPRKIITNFEELIDFFETIE